LREKQEHQLKPLLSMQSSTFSADDRCRLYGCFHANAKAAFRGVIAAPPRKEAERT
jgi:hypothetical protein